ncbi:PKD domain-containing protein [Tessaracoccus coleopterorum]|uniref:PKD domain-containing protein n=1 Tax=Tessaracoccus coleopterorum TaxID=2714950 RepID=UPI0038CD72BB
MLVDSVGDAHGTFSGTTLGVSGAVNGESDSAATLTRTGQVLTSTEDTVDQAVTVEAWVRTSSTRGGRIIGMGSQPAGNSTTTDSVLYLDNSGRPNFTVTDPARRTVTARNAIRDNQWHHVVGVAGADGLQIFVDGVRVARDQSVRASGFTGFWRIGSDITTGFANRPSDTGLAGTIDEVAVYPRALTLAEIQGRFQASGRVGGWGTRASDGYGTAVLADAPDLLWRLGETSGSVLDSSGSGNTGTVSGTVTRRQAGPVPGSYAATFNGSSGMVVAQQGWMNPGPFSAEIWFKTTTTRGGKLIGFGNTTSGLSTSTDRHVWMLNNGRLSFGTYAGVEQTLTSAQSYNDNQWHHVVATQGASGMRLYVDGVAVADNSSTGAQAYLGYWRIGGDRVWAGATSNYFAGQLAEAAVYPSALSADAVLAHFVAAGGTAPNRPPTAAFTTTKSFLGVAVDGSGSADPDGPLAGYSWNFGDGTTATGATATHTFAAPGTYQVSLTVTDPQGLSDTSTVPVTVAANAAPVAAFDAVVSGHTVALDAGDSSDGDGQITGYAWNFGDGTTGSGVTTTHDYGEAGTFTVSLTVTDDQGATHTTGKSVVTVDAPNSAPTAAFLATTDQLEATFDASGSEDPDGSIVSYAWAFGDGSTGTGPNPGHTYAQAGTYQVSLTVTDNRGAPTPSPRRCR